MNSEIPPPNPNPNPNPSPRAALEAQVTAYLLGELPAHEAAALSAKVENDAPLAQLMDRLRAALPLVREAAVSAAPLTAGAAASEAAAPMQLSAERRVKLLARFKTIAPEEFVAEPRPRSVFRTLVGIAAVFMLMLVLAGLLLPALAKSKAKAVAINIRSNLKQIEIAKEMWADENNKSANDAPTPSDLKPYLNGTTDGLPRSVLGETYKLGRVGEEPVAELDADKARKEFGSPLASQPRPLLERIPLLNKLAESANPNAPDRVQVSADGRVAYVDKEGGVEREGVGNTKLGVNYYSATNGLRFDNSAGNFKFEADGVTSVAAGTLPVTVDGALPSATPRRRTFGFEIPGALTPGVPLAAAPPPAPARMEIVLPKEAKDGDPNLLADSLDYNKQLRDKQISINYAQADDISTALGTLGGGHGTSIGAGKSVVAAGDHNGGLPDARSNAPRSAGGDSVALVDSLGANGSVTFGGGALSYQMQPTTPNSGTWYAADGAAISTASGEPVQRTNGLIMNFRNAPMSPVLDSLSRSSGYVINTPTDLSGTVTLWNDQPVSKEQAVSSLKQVLAEKGYGVVADGPTLTVKPLLESKKNGIEVVRGNIPDEVPNSADMRTQIVPLHTQNAVEMVKELQPLLSSNGTITADASVNEIVMTDTSANIRRSMEAVSALDKEKAAPGAVASADGAKDTQFYRLAGDGDLPASGGEAARTQTQVVTGTAASASPAAASDTVISSGLRNAVGGELAGGAGGGGGFGGGGGGGVGVGGRAGGSGAGGNPFAQELARNGGIPPNSIVAQGGTQPSLGGSPSSVNPGVLSSGLRNSFGRQLADTLPAIGTITGILTEPQSRPTTNALEQRDGTDANNPFRALLPANGGSMRGIGGGGRGGAAGVLGGGRRGGAAPAGSFAGMGSIQPGTPAQGPQSEFRANLGAIDEQLAVAATDEARKGELKENDAMVQVEKQWTRDAKSDEYVQRPNSFARPLLPSATVGDKLSQTEVVTESGRQANTENFNKLSNDLVFAEAGQAQSNPGPINTLNVVPLVAGQSSLVKEPERLGDTPILGSLFKRRAATLSATLPTLPGQAAISLDADGRGLVVQADDTTFAQQQVISRLDVNKDLFGNANRGEIVVAKNEGAVSGTDYLDLTRARGIQSNYLALNTTNQFRALMGRVLVSSDQNGVIAGSGGLTLNATNSYAGGTVVNNGTLVMTDGEQHTTNQLRNELVFEKAKPPMAPVEITRSKVLEISDLARPDKVPEQLALNKDFLAKSKELEALSKELGITPQTPFQQRVEQSKMGQTLADLKKIAAGVGLDLHSVGYDDPGQFVNQAQAAGTGGAPLNITSVLPPPHFVISKLGTNGTDGKNGTNRLGFLDNVTAGATELARVQQKQEALKDVAAKQPVSPPLEPQPEVLTSANAFSTFSLNVSDVSFKLAAASLEKGLMPDPGTVRTEEFINAFDYRDPEPGPGAPLAFAWERVRYPFAQNRDLVRFAIKTAAAGRVPGRPLNLVLLLDNSGSMERADRVAIIHEALRVLATQLQAQDTLSVVTFARTARLWVDGVSGSQAGNVAEQVGGLTPEGGTNLEEAMRLAYETARRHYLAGGVNRVVLLTDGAANLGNIDPTALKANVEVNRKQGIALDCFGIGWEGYNDDLLETLSRNGDGRYGFINTPAEAATGFAGQLAGALHVAASDVKVQIEFNPQRVTAYRQMGYAKHQLTKEQFRDNTVNAAQIGAAEEGTALYTVEINPAGEGPIGTVRVRSREPGTENYEEHAWTLPYSGAATSLEQGTAAMRVAATAGAFSEWLGQSPFAAEVTSDQLLRYLGNAPEVYGADARPKKLEWMIRQAKSLTGK